MSKLPIPKSRAGWYVSLIVISILFFIYYFCLYGSLGQKHIRFFQSPTEPVTINDHLKIHVYSPEYVSNFEFEELRIEVFNRSESETTDVKLLLAQNNNAMTVSVRLEGEEIELSPGSQKTIAIGEILPTDTVVKTIGIKTMQARGNLELVFGAILNGKKYDQIIPVTRPIVDHYDVLIHTFLQHILLPPWSNGFIPALVLFTTFLLEDRLKKGRPWGKNRPNTKNKHERNFLMWVRQVGETQFALVSLSSWLAVVSANTLIVLLFYGLLLLNSFKPSVLLVGFGCMGALLLARAIAGKPEKQDDDFYCGLNCMDINPSSTSTPLPVRIKPPLDGATQMLDETNESNFIQEDFKTLLLEPETGAQCLQLLALRKPSMSLPEFERYLQLIEYSDNWRDLLPELIAKIMKATTRQELEQCSFENPAIYQPIFDLVRQTTPQYELKLYEGKSVVEALAEMGKPKIIELLRNELQSPGAVQAFLPGLLSSNRCIGEKLRDFESIAEANQPAYWLDTFRSISESLSFRKADISTIHSFLEKGRRNNFPGFPLVERIEVEDRRRLIDMGVELSRLDPKFADFFIYKELCYLPDSFDNIFLEKLRDIGIALKKNQAYGLTDRMKHFVRHDWQNKPDQLPPNQPAAFTRKFNKAISRHRE